MSGAVARVARLVGVETLKVLGGRTIKIGVLAVAAVVAFTAWGHEKLADETAWTVAAKAFGAGLWAAEIFLLVAGTTAIAGETAMGTLKMILPHAYRRSDWIAAKAVVIAGQALVLLATAGIAAVVSGCLSGGLSDVTQHWAEGFGTAARVEVLHGAGEMTSHLASSAVVALASLVATGLLGLAISCLFDSVIPALSAGFLLFLGFKSAGTLFGASSELLEKIYASYPGAMLDKVQVIGRGIAEKWDPELLPRGLFLSAVVAAASLLVGLVVFSRRDLQA